MKLFDRKPRDAALLSLYRSYHDSRRAHVLRAALQERLFYVQTGSSGEGQRYEIHSSSGSILEIVELDLVHAMTYRTHMMLLVEVPLSVRLGPACEKKISPTPEGVKLFTKLSGLTRFETLEVLDEHFYREVERVCGNVPEAAGMG